MQAFSCLMYHNVCANGSLSDLTGEWAALSPSIKSYFVEESAFAAQIAAVQRSVDLLRLERVKNFFSSPVRRQQDLPIPDPRPSTLLTFDDGWRGTLDLALPILQRYAAEATVFVTTNLLDTPGFLRANELHQLPSLLQIGSHCQTHRFLNELSTEQIREELRVSKEELEQLTGRCVDTVSIPNGAVDKHFDLVAGLILLFLLMLELDSINGPSRQADVFAEELGIDGIAMPHDDSIAIANHRVQQRIVGAFGKGLSSLGHPDESQTQFSRSFQSATNQDRAGAEYRQLVANYDHGSALGSWCREQDVKDFRKDNVGQQTLGFCAQSLVTLREIEVEE